MCKFDQPAVPTRKPTSNRQPVSAGRLHYIVEVELARHLQTRKTFTAYGITLALRGSFPMLEIVHTEVRQIVHERMACLHVPYQQQMQVHGGEWALTYIPISIAVTIPQPAQLPPRMVWEDSPPTKTDSGRLEPLMLDVGSRR